jgi:DNA-binding transcriptional LysR family regulator
VRLTEDGETYLEAARAALDGLTEAEVALAARREDPVGRVRIDAPVGFGTLLIPTFASFRDQHPQVALELSLTDYQIDAVGAGWDIVIRVGELPATGELCDLGLGLYASPGYLEQHEPILSVQDVWKHEALIFRTGSGQLRPWTVRDGGRIIDLAPNAALIVADGRALLDASCHGLGIAQIFDKVAQPHVAAGALLHVLPEADVPGPPGHALIPLGRRMPPKTRVMLQHLSDVPGTRTSG